ncbi:MAG: toprim domain-containing protein, partial [Bacteroidia bacterium]
MVEGYMDVISMHRSGIQNVVASSGTSLTAEQVKAIHRFTSTVIILYDGDDAGQKAAQRAIPMLLEEGMQVKQVLFPDAHDPDSYAHTHGEIAFRRYLEDAPQDVINRAAEQARALGSSDPVQKSLKVRALAQWISCIPDTITRTLYVQSCAITLDIAESVIQQEVNKLRRQQAGTQREMEQLQTQATVLPSPAETKPPYTPGI